MAAALNAVPWISFPNSFTDAELKTFTNNVCSAISTYNFPTVWLEESNEEWNDAGRDVKWGSGNLGANGYGGEAGRNFSIMSAQAATQCPSLASRIHYSIGSQAGNSSVVYGMITGAATAGYAIPNTSQYGINDAPYIDNGSYSAGSESGSYAAQAAAYANAFFGFEARVMPDNIDSGTIYGDLGTIGSNNFLNIYEMGPSGYLPPANTEQSYLSEAGFPSAAWMAAEWLDGQQILGAVPPGNFGRRTVVQNEFTLAQIGIWPEREPTRLSGESSDDLDSDFGPGLPASAADRAVDGRREHFDDRQLLSGDGRFHERGRKCIQQQCLGLRIVERGVREHDQREPVLFADVPVNRDASEHGYHAAEYERHHG